MSFAQCTLLAIDDALDKVKAFKVGGVDYITKPFQVEEMLIRIKTQLTVQHFTQTLEQQVEQRTTELSQALHNFKEIQLQLVQHERIFEHLFTIKGVSKGIGLGLAIAHQIVVEKHQGAIAVNSTLEVV